MCSSVPDDYAAPKLTPHSYPVWVKGFGAFVVLVFSYALFSVPFNIGAARQLHRAENLAEIGQTKEAIAIYEPLLQKHPDSDKIKIDYAEACFMQRDYESVKKAVTLLEGVTLDKYDWKRLSKVMPEEVKSLFKVKKDKDEDK